MKRIDDNTLLETITNKPDFLSFFSKDKYSDFILFRCEGSETVLRQSEKSDYLFYLYSGKCKVIAYTENGKAIIINNLTAPCLIGEIELINKDNPFTVETIEESILLALPLNKYRDTLLHDSSFLFHLCSSLAQKERKTVVAYTHSVSYPLENRLAHFILDYAQEDVFKIKKVVIAESLGVSYRHLETVMSNLVKQGVLSKEKLTYYIKDRDRLSTLAKAMELF